jgi:uncharacterized iron-regulated membrane protein
VGLLIYRKFNRGSWWPGVRWGRGTRIVVADLHKVVGLGSVAFNILFGITGAVIGLEGIYYKYLAGDAPAQPQARLEPIETLPEGRFTQVMARTRELFPGTQISGVRLHQARTRPVRVHVEHPWTQMVKENASFAAFNAATGDLVELQDATADGVGLRAYYAMEPLHFGRFGGMPVKIMWAGMGLTGSFLSVSGFVIYIARKRKARRPVPGTAAVPAGSPIDAERQSTPGLVVTQRN